MTQEKMDRISALTRLSRERALTAEEETERAALRQEYLADWRRGAIETLESVRVVERAVGSGVRLAEAGEDLGSGRGLRLRAGGHAGGGYRRAAPGAP